MSSDTKLLQLTSTSIKRGSVVEELIGWCETLVSKQLKQRKEARQQLLPLLQHATVYQALNDAGSESHRRGSFVVPANRLAQSPLPSIG